MPIKSSNTIQIWTLIRSICHLKCLLLNNIKNINSRYPHLLFFYRFSNSNAWTPFTPNIFLKNEFSQINTQLLKLILTKFKKNSQSVILSKYTINITWNCFISISNSWFLEWFAYCPSHFLVPCSKKKNSRMQIQTNKFLHWP